MMQADGTISFCPATPS